MFKTLLLGVLGACLAASASADQPTKWQEIEKGMSDLLNEGWKIQGYSPFATNWTSAVGGGNRTTGDQIVIYPKDFEAQFLLSKGEKYIFCFIENPSPPKTTSKCRALN